MWNTPSNMMDLFKAMGGEMWGADGEPNRPEPACMKRESVFWIWSEDLVTNKWARTHDVPNLYISDASIFPSPTDKTTTIADHRFAMRTMRSHARDFSKGVHNRA